MNTKRTLHLIGDDLDTPDWIERALVELELEAQARLTAERVMDMIDGRQVAGVGP